MGTPNDAKINPDSWAEQMFRSLTMSAQELRCKCIPDEPYFLDALKTEREWLPGEGKYKYYVKVCSTCKRPPRYTLYLVVTYCEGCDRPYIPSKLPDKYNLCPKCDIPVPVRPRRKRANV